MKKLLISLLLLAAVPFYAIAGTVPDAAEDVTDQFDKQILKRLEDRAERSEVLIISTVAVDVNDFELTNSLARQFSEEIMRNMVEMGYRVNELRKSKEIVIQQRKGEFVLTRNLSKLASRDVKSVAVLAGTYTVTDESIRFNMRLLLAENNEVLAAGSGTIPRTDEIEALLEDNKKPKPPQPSVFTRLP